MLTAILTWFSTTVGKAVAKWGMIVAIVAAIYWRIYESGRSAEKAAGAQHEAETLTKRKSIDDKWIACLMLTCAISSLAGCATTASWSVANRPVRPTASNVETISSGAARAILQHNELGAASCGWKP